MKYRPKIMFNTCINKIDNLKTIYLFIMIQLFLSDCYQYYVKFQSIMINKCPKFRFIYYVLVFTIIHNLKYFQQ